MVRIRHLFAVALIALSPLAVKAAAPIKVGVILPLSGGAGPQGQHVANAIEAMAALLNEAGGVLGRPIRILAKDDESTP
ncbi:MAG TPA: ABC transporter substrate-binding protein, partial [Bordetella sp.]|nr:ABC transporter substrate-binding protein [Bordetella sp.]